ncbi:MAG: CAP domain-containing protein [Pirellulaceae bacterium]
MGSWSLVSLVVLASLAGEKSTLKPKTVPLHEHPTLVRMLDENNRLRVGVGRSPQRISPELTQAAQDHARYMARTGNFSHQSNGGPEGRAVRYGFSGLAGENIAMGQPTVASAFQSWRSSSGHWANIISGATLAGFGYAVAPDGSTYWVAMYGN